MYGIDRGYDFEFLIDKRLLQVCFGLFQLILNFDEDISITIEGNFDLSLSNKNKYKESISIEYDEVLFLIDQTIKEVQVLDTKTLEINFSNNKNLKLFDNNTNSESFQICSPSGIIAV